MWYKIQAQEWKKLFLRLNSSIRARLRLCPKKGSLKVRAPNSERNEKEESSSWEIWGAYLPKGHENSVRAISFCFVDYTIEGPLKLVFGASRNFLTTREEAQTPQKSLQETKEITGRIET